MNSIYQKLCAFFLALLVSTSVLARHETPRFTAAERLLLDKQSKLLNQQQWARVQAQVQASRAPKLWLITVGMSAESLAFSGDVASTRRFFSRVNGGVVSLSYSNLLKNKSVIEPLAHPKQLAKDLAQVGKLLSDGDKVLLMISTHGTVGELSVNVADFFGRMTDKDLSKAMEPLKNTPTTLILSACHSGSLIPALQANNRIILTSAATDRSSFGCNFESDGTWFIKALMAHNGGVEQSINSLFMDAQKTISKWEAKAGYTPSLPQISIGSSVKQWANQPIKQWLQ